MKPLISPVNFLWLFYFNHCMESVSEESLLIELKEIFNSKGKKLDIINDIRDRVDDYENDNEYSDELNKFWFILHGDDNIEGLYKKIERFLKEH